MERSRRGGREAVASDRQNGMEGRRLKPRQQLLEIARRSSSSSSQAVWSRPAGRCTPGRGCVLTTFSVRSVVAARLPSWSGPRDFTRVRDLRQRCTGRRPALLPDETSRRRVWATQRRGIGMASHPLAAAAVRRIG